MVVQYCSSYLKVFDQALCQVKCFKVSLLSNNDFLFPALAMQIDKHSVGYLTYHGGMRSMVSTSFVRDSGL